jgi:hypothetical protein
MIWALRTLRAKQALPALIVAAAGSVLLRDLSVLLPSIGTGAPFGSLPFTAITPLIAIVVVGGLQHSAAPLMSATSARPLQAMLVGFLLVASVAFVAAYAIAALVFDASWLEVARNTSGYIVLLLIGQRILGSRLGTAVPVVYVFLSTVFGRSGDGGIQPWAWEVTPATVPETVLFATIALAASVVAARVPIPNRWRES